MTAFLIRRARCCSGSHWEDAFLENVGRAENSDLFKHIRVAMFASRTLDVELEKNTQSVVPYIAITFILMAVFSVLTSMMSDQVRSKPWMGLMGNVSAIMATCAAFGLAMYLGIEFIGINLAAPFLMISECFVPLHGVQVLSVCGSGGFS